MTRFILKFPKARCETPPDQGQEGLGLRVFEGVPRLGLHFCRGPHNKDYGILGSTLGLVKGNYQMDLALVQYWGRGETLNPKPQRCCALRFFKAPEASTHNAQQDSTLTPHTLRGLGFRARLQTLHPACRACPSKRN